MDFTLLSSKSIRPFEITDQNKLAGTALAINAIQYADCTDRCARSFLLSLPFDGMAGPFDHSFVTPLRRTSGATQTPTMWYINANLCSDISTSSRLRLLSIQAIQNETFSNLSGPIACGPNTTSIDTHSSLRRSPLSPNVRHSNRTEQ